MAKVVVMPKLGLTMTEGTVSKWLKKVGDTVTEGEPLFEVETDKLTNTIEASASGVLRHLFVEEGITVPVLDKVAIIAEAAEDISGLMGGSAPAAAPAAPAAAPAAAAPAAAPVEKKAGGRVVASPAAKKLAKEKGIDLALVTGTGRPRSGGSAEDQGLSACRRRCKGPRNRSGEDRGKGPRSRRGHSPLSGEHP